VFHTERLRQEALEKKELLTEMDSLALLTAGLWS